MRKLVKKYIMDLFSLKRKDFISYSNHKPLSNKIQITTLNDDLMDQFKVKYPQKYAEWHNLKNCGVVVALLDGNIVGCGCLKSEKTKDKFYRIGKNVAYLSGFYVDSDYRGYGIYPMIISCLIEENTQYDEFFISAYTTNLSSINGLKKVGFMPIKRLTFFRICKSTLNKYKIYADMRTQEKKKILVVGGGTYQVPLIKRIIELGHTALCVDYNKEAPGFAFASQYKQIDVLDKDKCLAYAKENKVDAVMTYGATLPLSTVAYIGREMGLPALNEETADISTSKYKIKKQLAECGCNIYGDFFEMNSVEDAKSHTFSFPCVIKPCDGSGSKGVSIVHNDTELDTALECAFKAARYGTVYTEGFVQGEEYTVEAFVCDGKIYVYAIIKTTFEKTNDCNIHYGHRTPSGLTGDEEKKITEEIIKAISALNVNMASVNFDVILSEDDNKPYIIDCGIRIGQNLIASHIVPYSRGVNIIDNTIKLSLGEKVDASPKTKRCIATRLLIYNPGIITEIKDMSELINDDDNGIVDIVMRKKVGERQNEYREKSDTCGWVITQGSTPDEAEQLAEKARELLRNYIIIAEEKRN